MICARDMWLYVQLGFSSPVLDSMVNLRLVYDTITTSGADADHGLIFFSLRLCIEPHVGESLHEWYCPSTQNAYDVLAAAIQYCMSTHVRI